MWWGHYHGFFLFPLFVGFLIFVAFRIFAFRRYGGACRWNQGRFDAEAILMRRLVNGEINETEYQRLKEVLHAK
ncbi:MAG: hypothetical protein ACXVOI_08565 [Tumebacillaceae bacterium]